MSIAGLHRGVMIVLQLLLLTPASAADDPGSRFGEEMQKQQRIYQTDEEKMLENYVIDRSLENYAGALASGFEGTLAEKACRNMHWKIWENINSSPT